MSQQTMTTAEAVTMSAIDWATEEGQGTEVSCIRAWGFDNHGNSCTIKIPYRQKYYIELPLMYDSMDDDAFEVFAKHFINDLNRRLYPGYEGSVLEYAIEYRQPIYYYTNRKKRYIALSLPNNTTRYTLVRQGETGLVMRNSDGISILVTFKVHELNTDHRRRFLTSAGAMHFFQKYCHEQVFDGVNAELIEQGLPPMPKETDQNGIITIDRKLPHVLQYVARHGNRIQEEGRLYSHKHSGIGYTQWFKCVATPVSEANKLTSCTKEYTLDPALVAHIVPYTEQESSQWASAVCPKLLSYDIEQYSFNHKRMPRSKDITDAVFIITAVTQYLGKPETRKRFCITYAPQLMGYTDIKFHRDTKLVVVATEAEMELAFEQCVRDENPDVIMGYNIYGYDNRAINDRKSIQRRGWSNISRLSRHTTVIKSVSWASSAYGFVENVLLDAPGRMSVDVYTIVRRDFNKMSKFDLDTVSRKFLGRGKHPMKATRMFENRENLQTAQIVIQAPPHATGMALNIEFTDTVCNAILQALTQVLKSGGSITPYLHSVSQVQRQRMMDYAVEEFTKLMKYGVEDSELTIDLYEKLNIWYSLREFSSITGISMVDLHTRGQQIRGYSMVWDLASREGFVLNQVEPMKIPYKGAIVGHPVPGLYNNIICLDFASLYPTIIMALNLCWSTYIRREDWDRIPLEFCREFRWTEEIPKDDPEDNEPIAETKKRKKTKEVETYEHHYRILRPWIIDKDGNKQTRVFNHITGEWMELKEGVLPRCIKKMVDARTYVNKTLLPAEKDPVRREIYNQRQLALKVSANSMYGFTGVSEGGKLPMLALAAIVTRWGRVSITRTNELVENEGFAMTMPDGTKGPLLKGKVIYGDTDSTMVYFGITDSKMLNAFGLQLATHVTDTLFADLKPMKIEFEKAIKVMLCIVSKMYICIYIDKAGNPKIYSSGFLAKHVEIKGDNGVIYTEYIHAWRAANQGVKLSDHDGTPIALQDMIDPTDPKNTDALLKFLPRFVRFYDEAGQPVYFCSNPAAIYEKVHYYKATVEEAKYSTDPAIVYNATKDTRVLRYAIDGSSVVPRGVIIARRDGCGLQTKAFTEVMIHVMVKGMNLTSEWQQHMAAWTQYLQSLGHGGLKYAPNKYEILKIVMQGTHRYITASNIVGSYVWYLLHHQVPIKDLTFIKQMGGNYASDTATMKIFSDELKKDGKPVAPGERVEYVITTEGGEDAKLGNKIKTPEQYYERAESAEPYHIDTAYYVENVLQNCLGKLISVGFQEEISLLQAYQQAVGAPPKTKHAAKAKFVRDSNRLRVINHSMSISDKVIKPFPKLLRLRTQLIGEIGTLQDLKPSGVLERYRQRAAESSAQRAMHRGVLSFGRDIANIGRYFQQYLTQ